MSIEDVIKQVLVKMNNRDFEENDLSEFCINDLVNRQENYFHNPLTPKSNNSTCEKIDDFLHISPVHNYNLDAICAPDGTILAKFVSIPCVGGYSTNNISVTTESIPGNDDFYLIISREADPEPATNDPFFEISNQLLAVGSLVKVRSTFDYTVPFTLRLKISDNMDPESVKCSLVNGVLECMILAKKAKKPKVRKISINELK